MTNERLVLLFTDVVESTRQNAVLGDDRMAALWRSHDATSRLLARRWNGQEIGRSDGFFFVFRDSNAAIGFASEYHDALGRLDPPIVARVGIHEGPATLRENSEAEWKQGATRFDVDGLALPTAARIMSVARGGQTLVSSDVAASVAQPTNLISHGHWRFKGLDEVLEIFEAPRPGTPAQPPPDSDKGYRVVRAPAMWIPAPRGAP